MALPSRGAGLLTFSSGLVCACAIGALLVFHEHAVGHAQSKASPAVSSCARLPEAARRSWRITNNPPPIPELLAPAHATTTDSGRPLFTWTPVLDPEGDGVTFEIQIDDDAGFGSPEVEVRGLSETSFVPAQPLAQGTYCWRVRSIDDIQTESPYSAAFEIVIRPPGQP